MKPDTEYLETFYEVVSYFHTSPNSEILTNIEETQGRGGMWEYATELTNKFQERYENYEFDWDFYDKLDEFIVDYI